MQGTRKLDLGMEQAHHVSPQVCCEAYMLFYLSSPTGLYSST